MEEPNSQNFNLNHWNGKPAEDVLVEAFHEIRDPVYILTGYLQVLNRTEVSPEQLKSILESALRSALYSKQIVDSIYRYFEVQRERK